MEIFKKIFSPIPVQRPNTNKTTQPENYIRQVKRLYDQCRQELTLKRRQVNRLLGEVFTLKMLLILILFAFVFIITLLVVLFTQILTQIDEQFSVSNRYYV